MDLDLVMTKLYRVYIADDLNIHESVVLSIIFHKRDTYISREIMAHTLKLSLKTITNIFNSLIEKKYINRVVIGKQKNIPIYKTIILAKTNQLYFDVLKYESKKKSNKEDYDLTALFKKVIYKGVDNES